MSHTKGPWTIGDNRHFVAIEANPNDYLGLSCSVDKVDYDRSTAMANARLIAAAPEMLDLLSEIASDRDDRVSGGIKDKAAVIIAKATGTPTTKGPDE